MKNVCTKGKLIENFTFVNCQVVKKTSCRFAIDNIFFVATYDTPRYSDSRVMISDFCTVGKL